jgi:hypothetical protein
VFVSACEIALLLKQAVRDLYVETDRLKKIHAPVKKIAFMFEWPGWSDEAYSVSGFKPRRPYYSLFFHG